jgi:hypothetical protein
MKIAAVKIQARDLCLDCLALEGGNDRSSGNVGTTTNLRCLTSQKNADLKSIVGLCAGLEGVLGDWRCVSTPS